MDTKPPRITIASLIQNDLGYCCLWAFFTRNTRTVMIALRLGVTTRAIRKHKELFREGVYKCEGNCNCLKSYLERSK